MSRGFTDLFAQEEEELLAQTGDDSKSTATIRAIAFSREEPEVRAKRRITETLLAGNPVIVAFSAGKDSSALAALTLEAAAELVATGATCPPVVVLNSNTAVEQPEIVELAHAEIIKMEAYAARKGINFRWKIATPPQSVTWPVRVIGGRALPAFPDSRADCSTDWKVKTNERSLKEAMASLKREGVTAQPVVMTGVRRSESIARDQRISARGETAEGVWLNELGHLRRSPILDWAEDDVWAYLGTAAAGVYDCYSDFEDVMRIYRDAGGSSCVIVADMKLQSASKPCGTRTGCWVCTRVGEDKSMNTMIESEPKRYGYLKPLARLRDFVSRSQYDWSLRSYVGRTIDQKGDIQIAADVYSPQTLMRLLRYTLSAQVLSGVEIITPGQLVAIDASWSKYAIAPPFSALKIYFEVVEEGRIEQAPEIERVPKTPVPVIGKIRVGHPSFGSAMTGAVSGLRNVAWEMHSESCGPDLKTLGNGRIVMDVETDDPSEADEQGALDFIEFEGRRHVEDYCHESCSDWTWGFKTYLQYGVISLYKGRSHITDEILAMSQWRQENGLHGQRSVDELEALCHLTYGRQMDLLAA